METTQRPAVLFDGVQAGHPPVDAVVRGNVPPEEVAEVEKQWEKSRDELASAGIRLEHAHWDWRRKASPSSSEWYSFAAIWSEGQTQGVMAVCREPRRSRLGDGLILYVDFLEVAPWNIRVAGRVPRYVGAGTLLLSEAVRMSRIAGCNGRVGLHSLPQAEGFYTRLRMTPCGPDSWYHKLSYFEFTEEDATTFLVSIEGAGS